MHTAKSSENLVNSPSAALRNSFPKPTAGVENMSKPRVPMDAEETQNHCVSAIGSPTVRLSQRLASVQAPAAVRTIFPIRRFVPPQGCQFSCPGGKRTHHASYQPERKRERFPLPVLATRFGLVSGHEAGQSRDRSASILAQSASDRLNRQTATHRNGFPNLRPLADDLPGPAQVERPPSASQRARRRPETPHGRCVRAGR